MLVGPNGAGKTNLIEAISFLAPGRGLRRAHARRGRLHGRGERRLDEGLGGRGGGRGRARPRDARHRHRAGRHGRSTPPRPQVPDRSRAGRLGRRLCRSPARRLAHPAMDGLFAGPPAERRRFLDRLVLAVDAEHASRVSRARALPALAQPPAGRPAARSALARRRRARDRRARGRGCGAAAPRRCGGCRRRSPARTDRAPFPSAEIALDGWLETLAARAIPRSRSRTAIAPCSGTTAPRDAAAGRTLDGPHLTDLAVIYGPKGIAAADASTGEQKALLIGLVLAHAGLHRRR